MELPGEILENITPEVLALAKEGAWLEALGRSFARAGEKLREAAGESLGGLRDILLILLLSALTEALFFREEGRHTRYVHLAAAAAILLVSFSRVNRMMGLGESMVLEIERFSKVLLPVLAAATASMGRVGSAAVRQVSTALVCDVLVSAVSRVILPMIWLYAAAAAGGCMVGDRRMRGMAAGIRKGIVWLLGVLITLFTLYLSVAGAVAGSVDGTALRTAKRAVAASVPVVGGLLSAVTETVLAGAGILKNSVGLFGVLGLVGLCLLPFLRLGVQYFSFKVAAFLAGTLAPPALVELLEALAGVFVLVMAAAGSCAMVLLVSLISSLLVVAI